MGQNWLERGCSRGSLGRSLRESESRGVQTGARGQGRGARGEGVQTGAAYGEGAGARGQS